MNARLVIPLWIAVTLVAGLVTSFGPGYGQLPWWRAVLSGSLTFSPIVLALGLALFGRERIAIWVGLTIIAGYVIVVHLMARWLERLTWTQSRLVLYAVLIAIYGAGYLIDRYIVQRRQTPQGSDPLSEAS